MTNATNNVGTFNARGDRHARNVGPFLLSETIVRIGDARTVFEFVSNLGSRMFRVIYRCKDGTIRDMTGRQGVYNSRQDGRVQNVGHAMRNTDKMTLSFWTDCQGGKVNTGTGKGYRTLRAIGILAIRCEGTDILTDMGLAALGVSLNEILDSMPE